MIRSKSLPRTILLLLLTLLAICAMLIPNIAQAQTGDTNPWNEVVDEKGNIRFDNLTDLGETSQSAEWMDIPLPFGMKIDLDANYRRYQTPDGNIVVLPSPLTLVMMATNPQASGLNGANSQLGTGAMAAAEFLGGLLGNSIDWERVSSQHPEYTDPSQFWQAVTSGQANVWTFFAGYEFLADLATLSYNDLNLRLGLLMYLNGAADCTQIPGGCAGIIPRLPTPDPSRTPVLPIQCPAATLSQGSPSLSILKAEPAKPLVIGQDPEKRGADVNISVTIPPVIHTWYQRVEIREELCRNASAAQTANCTTAGGQRGIRVEEVVGYECIQHVDRYEEQVANLTAQASLDAASRVWITTGLAGKWYEAKLKRPNIGLIPGIGKYQTSCSGACTATALIERIPFADPGTYNLALDVKTAGTPLTRPRILKGSGTLQVFLTLVRSLPEGTAP
jgi:hypothetical protein